jgi:hypothetical protein
LTNQEWIIRKFKHTADPIKSTNPKLLQSYLNPTWLK